MKLPENARLGSTLYFRSPSLGEIMFIDVDVTPDDDGEVELLPEGIAELTRRWCVALNRRRKVKDFRPAMREEVVVHVQRRDGVDHRRAAAKPMLRLTRAASVVRAVSADGVRYRLRELSSRYFDVPQQRWLRCDHDRDLGCHSGGQYQSENEFEGCCNSATKCSDSARIVSAN
jgi:hypothetical protein